MRINFAWSDWHALLSISIRRPRLFPISCPTSSNISSKGKAQSWTQKGEWVKTIFAVVRPFFYLQRSNKLFSKFHGPLFSTHSIWYLEPNLNCKMLLPMSTISSSDSIFEAVFNVLFRALIFCYLFERSRPNKLNEHSSKRSARLCAVICISSVSSLVRQRLCNSSITAWSIEKRRVCFERWYAFREGVECPTKGELRSLPEGRGVKDSYKGREKSSLLLFCFFCIAISNHMKQLNSMSMFFFSNFFFFLRATNILHVVYLGTKLGFEVEKGKYKFLKRGQYNFSCTYFLKS